MSDTHHESINKRGIYLMADTPLTAHPLAVEGGGGDKLLLIEVLQEYLTEEEQRNLRSHLPEPEEPGTTVVCEDCGHARHTSEENPTLVTCQSCGSSNLEYAHE